MNDVAVEFGLRAFTVEEYHRLGSSGILGDDDRVELLDGLISSKMMHSPLHDATVCIVEELLRNRLVLPWILRIQCAVTLSQSEPEPDIAIVVGPVTRYMTRHPSPPDIAAVIEVAESSLARDRVKVNIYAQANVPVYWIVNLAEQTVEVYSKPSNGRYSSVESFSGSQDIPVNVGPDAWQSIRASSIFVSSSQ